MAAAENDNARYLMDAETLSDGKIAVLTVHGGTSSAGVVSGGTLWYGVYDPSDNGFAEEPVLLIDVYAKEASLAIKDDVPHVAYITSDDKIGYTNKTGGVWADLTVIESNNDNVAGALSSPDIAVDSSGFAHITYMDTRGLYSAKYDVSDGMYATNTTGSFVKTVIAPGSGWYDSPDGEYNAPDAPPKIALSESGYCVVISNHFAGKYYMGSWEHYYRVLFKTAPDSAVEYAASARVYDACGSGSNVYALIHAGGNYKVVNSSGSDVANTANGFASFAAGMTLDGSDIYYAAISGSDLLFYQNGTFVEGKSATTAVLSEHSRLSTVVSGGLQYILYTGTDDAKSLVISKLDGDTVTEHLVPCAPAAPNYADPVDVSTAAALASALPGTPNPDPIPVARLAADITVDSSNSIATMGKIIVPSGFTLTIDDGAVVESEVEIQSGGAVHVLPGGLLATTMGGNIDNSGSLTVDEGASLRSQMGGSVVNQNGAALTLNGIFECGCITDGSSQDIIWFENNGTVTGAGNAIMYSADDGVMAADLDASIAEMMDALGQVTRFDDFNDINISRFDRISDYAGFSAIFNADRTIKSEHVEGNMDVIVELSGNITVTGTLRGMIHVIVPQGRSLTIDDGASLTASVLNEGSVSVSSGGFLNSTMGGDIENFGILTVAGNGIIRSQMGGSVKNQSGATFTLNGLFECGCITDNGHDVIWFTNDGTTNGSGDAFMYDADPGGSLSADLDASIQVMMDALGQATRFDDFGDINIFKKLEIDNFSDLSSALTADRTIKSEHVDGNMDIVVDLTGNITVTSEIATMAQINVPLGVSLEIASDAILSSSITNDGDITVLSGGKLATTQGGDINNFGSLTVEPDAELLSQMGGKIINADTGTLTIDGFLFCGSYYDGNLTYIWFENDGTVAGDGHFVVMPVANGSLNDRIDATFLCISELGNPSPVPVYTSAVGFQELNDLNADSTTVQGIYLIREDGGEPLVHVSGNINMAGKKLCIEDSDLVIDYGYTLTLDSSSSLTFAKRFGKIVVEAPGTGGVNDANGGGTLVIDGTKLMSGSDSEAIFLVTNDIMFVGGAEYNSHPAPAAWIYIMDGGAASAHGAVPAALTNNGMLDLIVAERSSLLVTDDFSTRYMELRGALDRVGTSSITLDEVYYFNDSTIGDSVGSVITGTSATSFQTLFDLGSGDPQDVFPFATDVGGKYYFESNGVPYNPTRDGYDFDGWEIHSGWEGRSIFTSAMETTLQGLTVLTDDDAMSPYFGMHYVLSPTNFPIAVTAKWSGGPPPTYTISGTAAAWDDSDNAVYLLYSSAVSDSDIRADVSLVTPLLNSYTAGRSSISLNGDGKRHDQVFTFTGVSDGTYKLAIFKPGKHVTKIISVGVGGGDLPLGEIKLWLYGDVTYDGIVNAGDVMQVKRHVASLDSIFDAGSDQDKADREMAANVTAIVSGDVLVNAADIMQISRYGAGLNSVFDAMP